MYDKIVEIVNINTIIQYKMCKLENQYRYRIVSYRANSIDYALDISNILHDNQYSTWKLQNLDKRFGYKAFHSQRISSSAIIVS